MCKKNQVHSIKIKAGEYLDFLIIKTSRKHLHFQIGSDILKWPYYEKFRERIVKFVKKYQRVYFEVNRKMTLSNAT